MARACAGCAPYVFACFKGMERFADWLTGAAGPVFIFLAVLLTGTGGFIFFEVVFPSTSSFLPSFLHLLLAIPCFVIALNLYGHYYLVCSVPPGRPDDGEGRGKEGSGWWPWAKERKGAARVRELRRNEDAQEALLQGGGEQDSSSAGRREQQQPPQEKKCRKCGGAKPERTHHCSVCKTCILRYDHHVLPLDKPMRRAPKRTPFCPLHVLPRRLLHALHPPRLPSLLPLPGPHHPLALLHTSNRLHPPLGPCSRARDSRFRHAFMARPSGFVGRDKCGGAR